MRPGDDATPPPAPPDPRPDLPRARLPILEGQRVVALGDLHGDLTALRHTLRLAGLIDEQDGWTGENSILVQVGDQLDRGDQERAILHLLDALHEQAAKVGGGVYPLIGNHEIMNVALNFGYVTPGGWAEFADVPHRPDDPTLQHYVPEHRGRVAAFRPGGPYARRLAAHNTIMIVGDSLFVHGGLEPAFLTVTIGEMNAAVQAWMLGDGPLPSAVNGINGVVWSRRYSADTDATDCTYLRDVLDAVGAQRMVVAHTVQMDGINSACDGQVWRVDVGLSSFYGGRPQALEIQGDTVRVLGPEPAGP